MANLHNKQLDKLWVASCNKSEALESVGEQTQISIRCFTRKTRNDRKCMREFDSGRAQPQVESAPPTPLPDLASRAMTMPRRLHPRPKMLISRSLFFVSSLCNLLGGCHFRVLDGMDTEKLGPVTSPSLACFIL